MEGRFKGRDTGNLLLHISGVHCHIMVKQDLTLTDRNALDLDHILIGIKLNIITKTYHRNNTTKLQCDLTTNHNNTIQKITALIDIRQRNNSITKFKLDRVNLQQGNDILRTPDLLRRLLLGSNLLLDLLLLHRRFHNSSNCNKHHGINKTDPCL